eukprot:scaffold128343_cov30-Tisochrysis_lutea.AAC.7
MQGGGRTREKGYKRNAATPSTAFARQVGRLTFFPSWMEFTRDDGLRSSRSKMAMFQNAGAKTFPNVITSNVC